MDNKKAIDEFCTTPNRGLASLQELAQNFIVEQHEDNPNRAHVYIYSDIPFELKSSDVIQGNKDLFEGDNQLPAFEVKGEGSHGMAFCCPSLHKYQLPI